jgi:hypothetical protein
VSGEAVANLNHLLANPNLCRCIQQAQNPAENYCRI